MKYCILQETPIQTGGTIKNWVYISPRGNSTGMTSANRPAPEDFHYASREKAEADAQIFRDSDARAVEAGKRRRKNKPVPHIFTIVEVQ